MFTPALKLLNTILHVLISIRALEIYFLIGLLISFILWAIKIYHVVPALWPLLLNWIKQSTRQPLSRATKLLKAEEYEELLEETPAASPTLPPDQNPTDLPPPLDSSSQHQIRTSVITIPQLPSYPIPHFWKLQILSFILVTVSILAIFVPLPQITSPHLPLLDPLTVNKRQPLRIEFDRPLNFPALDVTISPTLAGQWVYANHKYTWPWQEKVDTLLIDTIEFYPSQTLEPATDYLVDLNHIQNFIPLLRPQDTTFIFSTPSSNQPNPASPPPNVSPTPVVYTENVVPISITPLDKTELVPVSTPIFVIFNQTVELESAQANFILQPPTPGIFSVSDNILIFTPQNNFAYGTTYQLSLNPGIQSPTGQISRKTYIQTFTTAPRTFKLDVPLVKQQHTFYCFAAAAQMVLNYYDIPLDQTEIWNQIGQDHTPRNFVTNTWGNPYKAIVGTVDGSDPGGYGVHWDPVATLISRYRPAEVKRHWDIPGLLNEIQANHPALIWWVNGVWPAKDVSWNTPEDGKVYTVNGMHVEVAVGWIGDINHPDFILTNDPWRGERHYTPDQFLSLWKWFDNTAVVVK